MKQVVRNPMLRSSLYLQTFLEGVSIIATQGVELIVARVLNMKVV